MIDAFEVRRLNLIKYIRDTHDGNRAEFCRATGKNPNLINLVLSSNTEYRRNIGEKLARDIEKRAGIAPGWLDSPRGIGERKVAKVALVLDSRDIPDAPPQTPDYFLTLPTDDPVVSQRVTGTANLLCCVIQDSAMAPTINVGNHVWVDVGVKEVTGDGVYVIRQGDHTVFRRIQIMPNGELRVATDDPIYAPQVVKPRSVKVVGRAIIKTVRTAL